MNKTEKLEICLTGSSFYIHSLLYSYSIPLLVCLQKLKDNENALLAFERSTSLMKPNIKSPLVFLNSAIFLYQMGKNESAAANFNNFVEESKEFVLSTEVRCTVNTWVFFLWSVENKMGIGPLI